MLQLTHGGAMPEVVINTRLFKPTDTKGTRIQAIADVIGEVTRHQLIRAYDDELDAYSNHKAVARALAEMIGVAELETVRVPEGRAGYRWRSARGAEVMPARVSGIMPLKEQSIAV
jgi:hypothetical protein